MSTPRDSQGPVPALLDPELERARRFIADYRLAVHDVRLQRLVTALDSVRDPGAYQRLRQLLLDALAPYQGWHEQVPFVTVDGLARGGIPLGEQFSNHMPVTLGAELEHVLVYGPTGSGKSHLLAHLLRAVLESEEVE
jgi:Cdc6-like AAA superfamily ATPase